jgi:NAD(P)-dependent dehydrogenase (short-subunit alcohol dehydrogenase family)
MTSTPWARRDRGHPVFRTVGDQVSFWESVLRAELLVLPVELGRVNVVAPGVIRSPLWSGLPQADREAMFESVGAGLPLGRVAEVENVAKAFVHLMDHDCLTGTVDVVDGGTLSA